MTLVDQWDEAFDLAVEQGCTPDEGCWESCWEAAFNTLDELRGTRSEFRSSQ